MHWFGNKNNVKRLLNFRTYKVSNYALKSINRMLQNCTNKTDKRRISLLLYSLMIDC